MYQETQDLVITVLWCDLNTFIKKTGVQIFEKKITQRTVVLFVYIHSVTDIDNLLRIKQVGKALSILKGHESRLYEAQWIMLVFSLYLLT